MKQRLPYLQGRIPWWKSGKFCVQRLKRKKRSISFRKEEQRREIETERNLKRQLNGLLNSGLWDQSQWTPWELMTAFPQEQAGSAHQQKLSFIPIATQHFQVSSVPLCHSLCYWLAENQLNHFSMMKIWFNIPCNVPTQVKLWDSDDKRPLWRANKRNGFSLPRTAQRLL